MKKFQIRGVANTLFGVAVGVALSGGIPNGWKPGIVFAIWVVATILYFEPRFLRARRADFGAPTGRSAP